MLVESVSAVCQLVLALGCSLSATRDVVRHESKKCRRAMYNDFMVACPVQEVTRFRSFDRLGAKSPLGEGCVGVVYSVNGGGWQVAAKTAKERGPLGFAGNKAAVAKEIQLAMSVSAHPCLTQLLGWSVETTCGSNRLFSIWDLVPTSPSMADALLEEASGASIFNLEGSLAFLADVLCHLQDHKFPAFDFHPVDMRVVCPKSGALRIIDWSGGFGLEGGNAALLPASWHASPDDRKRLLENLGAAEAAHGINSHVMAYYMLAVALAVEGACNGQIVRDAASGLLRHACRFVTEIHNHEWQAFVTQLFAKALPALSCLLRQAPELQLQLPKLVRVQRPPVPECLPPPPPFAPPPPPFAPPPRPAAYGNA